MSRSGVKGTALEAVVTDINRLVEDGTIKLHEIEAKMTAEDISVLESTIQSALWYPLDSFGRMTELLLEYEGEGRIQYLRDRGRRAAERIVASGIYNQLSANLAETYGNRVGKVMITLGPAMYKDTTWLHDSIQGEESDQPIGFRVVMSSPVDFPEVCRHSSQGFVEYLTERTVEVPYVVSSEQPTPDTVIFEGRRL